MPIPKGSRSWGQEPKRKYREDLDKKVESSDEIFDTKKPEIQSLDTTPRGGHGVRNFFLTILGLGMIAGIAYSISSNRPHQPKIMSYKPPTHQEQVYEQEQQGYKVPEVVQEPQSVKPEEQGPRVYGMGEWARAEDLEYRINSVKTRIWTSGELNEAYQRAEGTKPHKLSPEWYEVHSKYAIVNVTARGLGNEQGRAYFNLPLNIDETLYCIHQDIGGGSLTFSEFLYRVLNNEELTDAEAYVTRHTSATRDLPYEIKRWTTGDSRYGTLGRFMPEGIARLQLDDNVFIEIGNTGNW